MLWFARKSSPVHECLVVHRNSGSKNPQGLYSLISVKFVVYVCQRQACRTVCVSLVTIILTRSVRGGHLRQNTNIDLVENYKNMRSLVAQWALSFESLHKNRQSKVTRLITRSLQNIRLSNIALVSYKVCGWRRCRFFCRCTTNSDDHGICVRTVWREQTKALLRWLRVLFGPIYTNFLRCLIYML